MRREALGLVIILAAATACAADGSEAGVRASLQVRDGKTGFRVGEPIVLTLSIDAAEPVTIERAQPAYALTADEVIVSPTKGVYPWRIDSERFVGRFASDALPPIPPPATHFQVDVPLALRMRFDEPGTYTVRVVTRRVRPAATTNDVTFTVVASHAAVETERAGRIDREFRAATTERERERLAAELDALPDDAATAVKLGLLTGPTGHLSYMRHDATGLWIARDRAAVVARLEQAIVDPEQDFPMGSSILGTLVVLKASLEIPFEADAKEQPRASGGMVHLPGPFVTTTRRLAEDYVHRIALSLPARTGKSRIDAAQRVMWFHERSKAPMTIEDFVAARQILIEHFDDVNEYNVDMNLNGLGVLLEDPRMIPKLHLILDRPALKTTLFSNTRGLVLNLLGKLDPTAVRAQVAREACDDHPAGMTPIRNLPIDTVPEADECLRRKLVAQTAPEASRSQTTALNGTTMPYIARFASSALVPDVERAYEPLASGTDRRAAAAALAYLMRWNPDRDRPLLEAAAGQGRDLSLLFNVTVVAPPHSDALRAFLREHVALPPDRESVRYVSALGGMHDPDDDEFLRGRLAVLLSQDGASPEKIAAEQAIESVLRCNGWVRQGLRC